MLATILLAAVGITLWGLIGMNAMIAEVKNGYLADFEEEEQMHRSAWAIEIEARHGAIACEQGNAVAATVAQRVAAASRELASLLRRYAGHVSPTMVNAAVGYQRFGEQVSRGEVCALLRDPNLDRQRLLLDEELTNSWITKLRELRLAITENELAAQRTGSMATMAGLVLGMLALLVAALTARLVARGVTVPLAQIAVHARRLGEGDFSPLPVMSREPREVCQLSNELDRMRARLSEVNQLKQSFLDSVSHDLRTPLAHIREALCLLLDGTVGGLQPKQQRVAQLALRACEREIRLVSALLDLSRLRSGQPLRMQEQQSIDAIVDSAVDSAQEMAERANVRVRVEAGPEVPLLRVDSVLVETAVFNVLSNAIAASPSGGTISVERSRSDLGPDGTGSACGFLRLVVRDEGAGIDAALERKVFEPFFTTKTGMQGSGSGLGLPLARDMLRAHGGDLTLLPRSSSGAAFALWLPIEAPVCATAADRPPPVEPASTRRFT